jgi:uncharacterized protein (DUF1810 family)
MIQADPYDLDRFLVAQQPVIGAVRDELRLGRKASHWMWFVFPQLAGLGRSAMSQHYAIGSIEEARAFLDHPVLGMRLVECVELVLAVEGRTAHDIFGSPDDMKLRSCLTLFDAIDRNGVFARALERYFEGRPDRATLDLLG